MVEQYSTSNLVFTVRRRPPELVAPARPTPREFKLLSDIDDQEGLRVQVPFVHLYRNEASMAGKDPVKVIREALGEVLVYYYPFAGRLREGDGRKLIVECNGEGVMFIEADADVSLHEFGNAPKPPFPCFHELLYDVPGSQGILHSPLLLIQVTRLECGGFVFALRMNHTMSDAPGIVQFLNALAEIANGAPEPSVKPVWRRELFDARDPPRVTRTHRELEKVPATIAPSPLTVQRAFFFGPTKISAIRCLLPHHLATRSTSFELLTAYLWRCRTRALQLNPGEDVRVMLPVNVRYGRGRFNPPIPSGYYGNAFVYPAAVTSAGRLLESPLGYALDLVRRAKSEVSEEYVHSVADLMVTNGRPLFTPVRSWIVSDVTHVGFRNVDFGWGKAVFAGQAKAGLGSFTGLCFYVGGSNGIEEGRVVLICLPVDAMDRFVKELDQALKA